MGHGRDGEVVAGDDAVQRQSSHRRLRLPRLGHRAAPLESPDEFGRRLEKQLGVDNGRGVSAWIKEKRCLVVVDDVSSGEEWDHIRPCFDAICDGGRVVVTTRREDVARQCAGDNVYELKPLAPGEALKLLCQKVYKDDEYKLSEHMKEEANLILRRCRGLPLAIATIGGLLANRPKTSREWMNLGDHLGSELEYDRDIMRVITSSYDGLPYHLKTCFLYLSIFPENYEIRCTRLLRRWMAEGYIAKPRDMTIEEVGRRHYKELINRSMIQPSKKVRASMAVERCRVHGVVLQIILSKSVEENQLFIMDNHCNEAPQSKIRHLVVTRRKKSENMSSINLSLIRSLTVFGECPLSLITPKLRLLRVLDLEDTIGLENDDLKHVGELRHLRYLGLRGTNISALPSSLQNLVCLETLDVQDTKVTWFPHGITKLENLRYLVGGINFAKDLVEKMGKKNATKGNNNCSKTLADFVCGCYGGYKEQSQCLCSGCTCEFSVRAPERIEKLRNLLVLGVLHIAQGSEVARNLGKLTNLRRLGVDLEADGGAWMELCSSISRLVHLERLEVRSESLEFLKDTSKDKSPPKHLTSLRLCGRLGNLPSWMSSLNDLSKVKLLRTQLKQEEIRVLGKLGNLTLLGLWEDSFMEESLCFSNGTFKKLKLLYIEGLKNLKTIQIEDGTLTVLENLRVRKCLQLHDGEKGFSGVVFLRNLNELALTSCGEKPELEKALQLQIVGLANRPTLITGKSIVLRSAPSLRHFLPMEADCA